MGVPQHNDRVEMKYRHLTEVARVLRIHANLPKKFWGDCILTSTYLINKIPTPVLGWKSPYEVLMGKKLVYDHLGVFGNRCFVYNCDRGKDKFDPKGRKCVFIRHLYAQKVYKVYDLESHKTLVSRDVVFQEDVFPFHLPKTESTSSHVPVVSRHDGEYIDFYNTPLALNLFKDHNTYSDHVDDTNNSHELFVIMIILLLLLVITFLLLLLFLKILHLPHFP